MREANADPREPVTRPDVQVAASVIGRREIERMMCQHWYLLLLSGRSVRKEVRGVGPLRYSRCEPGASTSGCACKCLTCARKSEEPFCTFHAPSKEGLKVMYARQSVTPGQNARTNKPLFEPRWKSCPMSQCSGVALAPYGRCLRHIDLPELDQILQVSRATGNLDGRGVYFCPELLERIYLCSLSARTKFKRKYHRIPISVAAAPEWPTTWSPRFDGAKFGSEVSFVRVKFGPKTSFRGADLRNVTFRQATFGANSSFSDAYIERGNFVPSSVRA